MVSEFHLVVIFYILLSTYWYLPSFVFTNPFKKEPGDQQQMPRSLFAKISWRSLMPMSWCISPAPTWRWQSSTRWRAMHEWTYSCIHTLSTNRRRLYLVSKIHSFSNFEFPFLYFTHFILPYKWDLTTVYMCRCCRSVRRRAFAISSPCAETHRPVRPGSRWKAASPRQPTWSHTFAADTANTSASELRDIPKGILTATVP